MYSDDQGQTWNFQGWVISSPEPCWTTAYQPDGMTGGQDPANYTLGVGDFSFIDNTSRDGYAYIFYTKACVGYVARTNPNTSPFTFTKYYDGSFSSAGNGGPETAVDNPPNNVVEPSIGYSTYLNKFVLVSFNNTALGNGGADVQIQTSPDMITWSAPQLFTNSENSTYFTVCNTNSSGNIKDLGQTFRLLFNKWGSDIHKADITTSF